MRIVIVIMLLILSTSCALPIDDESNQKAEVLVPSQIANLNPIITSTISKPQKVFTIRPSKTSLPRPNCRFGPKEFYAATRFTPIDGHNIIAFSVRFPDDGLTILNPSNNESIPLHRLMENKITGIDIGPKWSPDGKRIAFIFLDSLSYLMIADLETGEICPISEGIHIYREYNDSINWSPDGKKIAWINHFKNSNAEIQVIDLDEGNSMIVTQEVTSERIQWIDNKHIAFIRSTPNKQNSDLVIVSIDSKEIRTFLSNIPSLFDFSFSPDGQWLAYTNGNFYLNNLKSGILRQYSGIKHGLLSYYFISWSPDSKKILFPGFSERIQQYIFWIDKPDLEPQELFHGYCSSEPWAPDSQRFVSTLTPNQGGWNLIINNIFDEKGTNIPTLTRYPRDAAWNKI
jgi:Tol biopolymer transport system component